MTETVLFDGRVHVDHHQAYVESGRAEAGFDRAFAGQVNGLIGAGLRGALTLSTGTALGFVGLRVLLRQDPPGDAGPEWQEVAEVPFRPAGRHLRISDPLGALSGSFELPLEDYRVRLSAKGIDEAWDLTVGNDDPLLDHYELVFWPEVWSPDVLVRSTSTNRIPTPPPAGPTFDETGPSTPDWSAQLDQDLAHDVASAGPYVQRHVAYWAADRSCRAAGIADLELVAAALSALWMDEPLPLRWSFEGSIAGRLQDDGVSGAEVEAALHAVEVAVGEDPREAAGQALAALRRVVGEHGCAAEFRAAAVRTAELLADEDAASSEDSRRFQPVEVYDPETAPAPARDREAGWSAPPLPAHDRRAWYLDPRPVDERLATLAVEFPDLLLRAGSLDPTRQRDTAFAVARWCLQTSGLNELYWPNDAFLAFGQDSAPPPWIEGTEGLELLADRRWRERTTVQDGRDVPVWPLALRALRYAVGPDPREALLLAVVAALQVAGDTGDDYLLRMVDHEMGQ